MKTDWRSSVIAQLEKEAEQFLQTSTVSISFDTYRKFMRNGDRQSYEALYFLQRKRLTTFGLLQFLYPERQAYTEALENEIWQVCNEFTWCLPAHLDRQFEEQDYKTYQQTNQLQYTVDLFAAETAFTLAEMIHFFGEHLDDFLVEKVKIEIDRRVFIPFLDGSFHWEKATHNWASVCGGSIGAAALYLMNGDRKQSLIIDRVIQTMNYYLAGFEEDGACTEGYGYWQYGFGYFVYFADLLKRYRNIDLFEYPKVKAVALFQQKVFLADNTVVNFSDAAPTAAPMIGFTHYLHKKFSEVHVPTESLATTSIVDHCGRWAPAIRELCWYDPKLKGRNWPTGSCLMEDSSIFLSRIEQHAFAVKAGHNHEPHNHNDIGQFILYSRGNVFLRDLGSGQYHKDYFSDKRYQFICNSAEGHSVPVVNGFYQQEGARFYGEIIHAEQNNNYDEIELDLSRAYPGQLQFTRSFQYYKTEHPKLVIIDNFLFNESPSSLVESFIAEDLPFDLQDNKLYLEGDKETLEISYEKDIVLPTVKRKSFRNHQGEIECYLHILCEVVSLNKQVSLRFECNLLGGK
ncbi:Heparinase II/III-like protein [Gracilibacillus orientalis]|uniref:Heparinase II/III-like protein n=1 Tax=Gracilibacillus orientalis TaxID=334253 RepID=A0A1I4IFK3_9BACI|nr:heparinase II/III family protein [Gracilibacillus orientalis]SFL53152.1 Heparinase II/III-like protein [Gracilibacillus orientalis]